MERKVGDIISLIPMSDTLSLTFPLDFYGINYDSDSKFEIIEISKRWRFDGEQYLVNGLNGENETWNRMCTTTGFWVGEMHISK